MIATLVMLNWMYLRDGLGHCAWLVPASPNTSIQPHTLYIAELIFWRRWTSTMNLMIHTLRCYSFIASIDHVTHSLLIVRDGNGTPLPDNLKPWLHLRLLLALEATTSSFLWNEDNKISPCSTTTYVASWT